MSKNHYDTVGPLKYNENLVDSQLFQDFLCDVLEGLNIVIRFYQSIYYQFGRGESLEGCEVKLDRKARTTENVFMEVSEKAHKHAVDFTPSGILSGKHDVYIIGNYDTVWFFHTRDLIATYRDNNYRIVPVWSEGRQTGEGFLLPKVLAERIAFRILRLNRYDEVETALEFYSKDDAEAGCAIHQVAIRPIPAEDNIRFPERGGF